ncbi:cytochrome P450, partial [Cypionkella sp.]|uniref:cytochrome P450 n=1 Tax=Cypionkella sp. TaxID=2811411 RepID=UPI002ABA34A6
MIPPKPHPRADKVSLLQYLRLFRADILSAQPARLYRAWMAEFRTPFFRSYMCNDPDLVNRVLVERPDDFPKSNRIREGLNPLLGNSVFVTNGEVWKRQRRIIDPAFEGGRLRDTFPAMWAAGQAAVARMPLGEVEVEQEMSHAAADVIFRTLFSIPIEHEVASAVFAEFRTYQRTQPILNLAAFLPLPRWVPRFHRAATKRSAAVIRGLITRLTESRAAEISAGTAPDDLATKIMVTADPLTGARFETAEMVDQVAIFFLAGHETSASALSWALLMLAMDPDVQERVATEAQALGDQPEFSALSKLRFTRDVFREVLRLYPPVPMMVRENACPEKMRGRNVAKGAQIVLSPWHLQRHERIWDRPDEFDPNRWQTEENRACARDAYMPFSAGPRVCTGAGFAMVEGTLLLALLARAFR